MLLKKRQLFFPATRQGVLVYGNSFYTQAQGLEKVCFRSTETRSDLIDTVERSFSSDNGQTWSTFEPLPCIQKTFQGTLRQFRFPSFVDPVNGRLLTMVLEGVLPGDEPLEGMKQYYLRYQVSIDGGRTNQIDDLMIQKGDYTPEHPCEGVWVGKNSIMMGDLCCRPIRTTSGKILVPVQIYPVGSDGEYYNPGGGYTYHEATVLIGTWQDDGHLEWDLSHRIANDPAKSTRGCIEPTLAQMPDGRILMVLRGSNGGTKDPDCQIPGYRWYSISTDGGYTWSPVQPWTYEDGSSFFSPSSCSQLLNHSNGRYYWLGNITPRNPQANSPRYPLVIGEVDPVSCLLKKSTIVVIDDREPKDHPDTMLSCFMAHEDRQTSEIVLHMSRLFTAGEVNWTGSAFQYRIRSD
jgi:hypothetical protein